MLTIPLLSKFIEGTVQKQLVADSVDYLNYYVTSILLAFFSMAISAKQYFGSPIQCWVPSEFKGGWEKYAEDYCFIANSYYVPIDKDVPAHGSHGREDHISYYRWVPIVLALQAFCFFFPNWLWTVMHRQTAINPVAFLEEAEKLRTLTGEEREKELASLANYFMDTVSVFGNTRYKKRFDTAPQNGHNAAYLYLLTKAAYVVNIFFQMILLNHFLGESYIHWGYQVASNIIQGKEWVESEVFPRVIMCDFQIRRLGNLQNHTVQCVIMMNMINEKLYLFLYFWFIMLGVVTLVNFFYYLVWLMVPSLRTRFVLLNVDANVKGASSMRRRDYERFATECLHPDGVLLLQFLREHVSGRITLELTAKLLDMYCSQEVGPEDYRSFSDDSIEKHPHSPLIEKYSEPPNYRQFAPNQLQSYYPTPSKSFGSAPMADYLDSGTMRVEDRSPRESRSSPTDV